MSKSEESTLELHCRNLAAFSISALSCMAGWTYWYYGSTSMYQTLAPFFFTYVSVDLFFTKNMDHRIHHTLCMSMFYYLWNVDAPYESSVPIFYRLFNMEFSTIFLVGTHWIRHPTLAAINQLCFVVTFAKYRIYDYYWYLVDYPSIVHQHVQTYASNNVWLSGCIHITIYGLFALNLYWATIILKVLYKPLTRWHSMFNSLYLQHKLCALTGCIRVLWSMYQYMHGRSVVEMFGITNLGIASYRYHEHASRKLDYPDPKPYPESKRDSEFFWADQVAIQLRTFLTMWVHVSASDSGWWVAASVCIHCVSLCGIHRNLMQLQWESDYQKDRFLYLNRCWAFMPIIYDVWACGCMMPMETRIFWWLYYYCMALAVTEKPFYHLSHVVVI